MIKNDKAWIGDLLGGPLMSRESRVIAELLLRKVRISGEILLG